MFGQQRVLSGSDLPVTRQSWILRKIADSGAVHTNDLADELHVSVETIRRDLASLERNGAVERVHGGAVSLGQRLGQEPSFQDRSAASAPAKTRIGVAAAGLVQDGATLFVDVGTTALAVAAALPAGFHGIVATNSLLAAAELARRPGLTVLATGGRVRPDDMAMAGQHALALLECLRVDVAFLGSGGVHPTSGLTDFHIDEVATRHVMMRNSAKTYVLADSRKFNVIAPFHVATWDAFTGLITDAEPPAGLRTAIVNAGAEVVVAT